MTGSGSGGPTPVATTARCSCRRLFADGPASRADLARSSGLTRVTVSDLVAESIGEGLLEELGAPVETRVGKPPTLVGLVPDAKQVVAIDLSVDDQVVGAVLTLAGEVVLRDARPLDGRRGAEAAALVEEFAADLAGRSSRPLLGVAVATPGVVSPEGVVLDAPNLGWRDVPLAETLGATLDLPVYVANDANTAVMGEYTFGGGGEGGLLLLRLSTGVGAGLVLGGAVLHGNGGAAGEIGHVQVDPAGETCGCGRPGCLETFVAVPRLRRRVADGTADEVLRDAGDRLGQGARAGRGHPQPRRGRAQRPGRPRRAPGVVRRGGRPGPGHAGLLRRLRRPGLDPRRRRRPRRCDRRRPLGRVSASPDPPHHHQERSKGTSCANQEDPGGRGHHRAPGRNRRVRLGERRRQQGRWAGEGRPRRLAQRNRHPAAGPGLAEEDLRGAEPGLHPDHRAAGVGGPRRAAHHRADLGGPDARRGRGGQHPGTDLHHGRRVQRPDRRPRRPRRRRPADRLRRGGHGRRQDLRRAVLRRLDLRVLPQGPLRPGRDHRRADHDGGVHQRSREG
ncbi:ROK family protein [Nocardioides convexus]|uniref:ROK family protein n=1 Tax=Nocardioides convexus TaxID=2712224 RepID=UPI00241827D9|nr:ROK family protein [Nocardioides convexus]